MMKSKWLVLAVLILSMLTFTACGKKKEESFEEVDPEAVVEEAQKEVEEADAKKDEFLADFTGEMDLTGSWQDEVSQRATMDVEKAETGTYHILIHWASGAKEASTWEISGTYDETSGMLSYEDGHYSVHTWDDEDQETVSGEELTKGALMKEGDKLRWQDSEISEDAVFVKISE
jgi:hypothetical protein